MVTLLGRCSGGSGKLATSTAQRPRNSDGAFGAEFTGVASTAAKMKLETANLILRPLTEEDDISALPSFSGGGSRRPGTKSLWLLPSGPDQVGDSAVRRLPNAHMVEPRMQRKFTIQVRLFH